MMKQNKKIAGVILIAFLLPILACNVPRTLFKAITFGGEKGPRRIMERVYGATIVPDNYDSSSSNSDGESSNIEEDYESEDCSSDGSWLDEFWDGAVVPLLVEEGKNCQESAGWIYRSCLQDQAASGACLEQAKIACSFEYDTIPLNDSGGSVTISPSILHGFAESESTSLTYPSGGGTVSGQFFFTVYDNVNECTITTTSTINSGSYDQATCKMSGTAQLTNLYEGLSCLGICGFSLGACPKTRQANVPWKASLEDGELSGNVGIRAPDISGFGFRAGP
ncbi:MAG: hypothetical protein V3R33_09630 [Anaerolineales bacterium]